MRRLTMTLSPKSVDRLISQIQKEKVRIMLKNSQIVLALCKLGATNAKANLAGLRAVDTGALYLSIGYQHSPKLAIVEGSVYAREPYAKFVEYGWGIGGEQEPHQKLNPQYVYNYNGRNLIGYQSRPYMYLSAVEMRLKLYTIAKEKFAK